ncbi:P22 phage major capsid protein family protein [Microterricola viridarii]|uniref:p22 coat protein-gene protein 5 n=1 Tax=Microterricola viridarii TaxID=412690 RepID=A0A1H1YMC1_9MICO|nr:P22 phage major capsid protein family protein [Microterricola viridarii]SDT22541.1 P22 coat protein-gene protein 5 [Microterricola viridarii]
MANKFLTPNVIAAQALATLYETTHMLPLVYTDVTSEFATQKIGNTINVRKPAVFEAKLFDRAQGIQPQDATEGDIPVVLDKIADVSFVVTSEDLTLEIEKFEEQLLTSAMGAISQHIDRAILGLRSTVTQTVGVAAGLEWDKPESLIDAGRILDINKVSPSDRYSVVGPTTKAKWLNTDLLKQADKSGSTEALRQGSIGKDLFGFESYWTQNVGQAPVPGVTGDPTTEVNLAFHKTAFAFASAPLEIAPGSNAAVVNYKGISIRVAYDYDIKYKHTVVSLDTLYGVKTLDAKRAVLINGANQA